MAQGVEISRGKYADTLHDTQSFLLGERVKDNKTQTEWTYVRFDEILNVGDFVRDSVTADLVAIESGTTYAQVLLFPLLARICLSIPVNLPTKIMLARLE